jgi:EAL and modified HD-GYP domain-containing signal transduction protein
MARQPIFDRNGNIVAYELLFRNKQGQAPSNFTTLDEQTALANVLLNVGLDKLAKDTIAYVNVPTSLLYSDAIRLLRPERVVLEVLETVEESAATQEELRKLKSLGYTLALDDYTFEERNSRLIPAVDIVKVDVLAVTPEDLVRKIPLLKQTGRTILAEKVETREMHQFCHTLGFDLFQGYFYSKPVTLKGSSRPSNYHALVAILEKLQDPDVTTLEIEGLLCGDILLCEKILRMVNCAANCVGREINSIRQAIMFLGLKQIRTLTELAFVGSISGKPPELYELSIHRARFCQRIAEISSLERPAVHFTVGLLSAIDALLDSPMEQIVSELGLSQTVQDALLGSDLESDCAKSLRTITAIESGDWATAHELFPEMPSELYGESLAWAEDRTKLMCA